MLNKLEQSPPKLGSLPLCYSLGSIIWGPVSKMDLSLMVLFLTELIKQLNSDNHLIWPFQVIIEISFHHVYQNGDVITIHWAFTISSNA